MPRYFFNVRTGGVFDEDKDGSEFLSYELAYDEAVRSAREIVGELVIHGEIVDGRTFEITNEAGAIVGSLPMKSVVRFE